MMRSKTKWEKITHLDDAMCAMRIMHMLEQRFLDGATQPQVKMRLSTTLPKVKIVLARPSHITSIHLSHLETYKFSLVSCSYLIFVTTITTAGCVTNSVKCKIFRWVHEETAYNFTQML